MYPEPPRSWAALSIGGYVLFRRIPEGLNVLGILMALLQTFIIIAAFMV